METMMSEKCEDIAQALGSAQAKMPPITFDAVNPHFRNKYATLAHILATVRPVLLAHDLTLTQLGTKDGTLVTMLLHKSGQWIRSELPIIADKAGPQPFGSAMSYARRYGLCAILNVAAEEEDDDAERAQQPFRTPDPPKAEKPLPRVVMIGETDRRAIFAAANRRAKKIGDKGVDGEMIVRSIGKAWNLPLNENGQPSTHHIPARFAQAFIALCDRWEPGMIVEPPEDF
jgi:hypothetical protein